MGITLYKTKRYQEAIKSFEKDKTLLEAKFKGREDHPNFEKVTNNFLSKVYFNIGKAYYRLNQLAECEHYLCESLALTEEKATIDEILSTFEHSPDL